MDNPDKKFNKRILDSVAKEMEIWMDEVLKEAFDPARLMNFMKDLGINLSDLGDMSGKQSGFDPYWILELPSSASDDELKSRFASLIKYLHPDTAKIRGTGNIARLVIAYYQMIKREREGLK